MYCRPYNKHNVGNHNKTKHKNQSVIFLYITVMLFCCNLWTKTSSVVLMEICAEVKIQLLLTLLTKKQKK